MSASARYSSLNNYQPLNNHDNHYYNNAYPTYRPRSYSASKSYDSESYRDVINNVGPNSLYHRPGHHTYIHDNGHSYSSSNKINDDPNPVRMVRQTAPVTHRQNVRIRYLDPPSPPQHAPIVVKERMLTPPPPPPPLVIRQRAATPPTPPPLVIRERPPHEPQVAREITYIEKILPGPTPPPRQVIIERIPNPQKPRDLIYEKWLPYQRPDDRQVIVERGKTFARIPTPKNVIIDHEVPHISVQQHVYNEGTHRADPYRNNQLYGSTNAQLKIVDRIHDLPNHTVYTSNQSRPTTPSYYLQKLEVMQSRPPALLRSSTDMPSKLPSTAMGPFNYSGPWNTTYRSSYTGKRVN